MQGLGIRTTTNTEKHVYINNLSECDACAQKCFEIIKNGREKGTITINGEYDYPHFGYGVYGKKKTVVGGDYVVHNSGQLVCKVVLSYVSYGDYRNYVRQIHVGNCIYEFDKKTDNTIFLKSTIFGYFKNKDDEKASRIEQQKQEMQKAQESKRNAEIASAQRLLDEMYKGM